MALNKIIIMGRLTRDPELKKTNDGVSVTSFSLAVERDIKNKDTGTRAADFIECVAWRYTAEFVTKYFKKGSMAVVSGRLQIDEYTDKDGVKRRAPEIIVENVYFGESNNGNRGTSNAESNQASGDFTDVQDYNEEEPYTLPF